MLTLSAKNRAFLNQTGPSKVGKGPSQTNTGPTKNPPRVTQITFRPTECSPGQIEGLHELKEGPFQPEGVPSQTSTGYGQPTKNLLGALEGLFNSNSGLRLTRACKRVLKPMQGQLRLTKASEHRTGPSLADKCHLGTKKALLNQKETLSLRVAQVTFKPT